jgi:hypothetical protein
MIANTSNIVETGSVGLKELKQRNEEESTLKSLNERYAELQRRSKELDISRDKLRKGMLKFLRFIVLETQEKKREIEHFNEKLLLQTVYSNDLEQIYQNMNHLIRVVDQQHLNDVHDMGVVAEMNDTTHSIERLNPSKLEMASLFSVNYESLAYTNRMLPTILLN